MLQIVIEKSFKKDVNRDKKSGKYSGKDFKTLKEIISSLQNKDSIHPKFKRHPLKGRMKGYESIHLKSDWLLIYKIDTTYLYLTMLGKHTQVYQKYK
ncbi:MAG: type II toxin-antitoxin system YafQ family toxin [Candidatus Marinimicrobia bacterium]|nr:type II toxin-antitoxin system YafQ family toxin [Candidatus Neomarinimicrobiota bacterium]